MCPKTHTNLNTMPQFTQGFSLVFLLFTIIIVTLLAAALVQLTRQSTIANTQQVISTRAFYAAESGAQRQAMSIFPVSGGAGVCSNQNYSFTVSGLNGCTASTTCTASTVNGTNYYQVTSRGQCNAGQPLQATRTIEIRLQSLE